MREARGTWTVAHSSRHFKFPPLNMFIFIMFSLMKVVYYIALLHSVLLSLYVYGLTSMREERRGNDRVTKFQIDEKKLKARRIQDIRSVKCPVRSLLDTPYNGARLRTSLKRAAQIAKASRGRVMTLPAARAPGFLVPYLAPAAYDVAPP